jgi:hypothetical protein
VWTLDVKDTIILIPEVQFKDFLAELNESFPNESLHPVESESQWRYRSLIVDFPGHPRLAPRFLGVSDTKGTFDRLCRRIPVQSSRGPDNVMSVPPSTFEQTAFNQVVTEILEALKTSRTHSRQLRRNERAKKCRDQMLFTQKFLGLRPTVGSLVSSIEWLCSANRRQTTRLIPTSSQRLRSGRTRGRPFRASGIPYSSASTLRPGRRTTVISPRPASPSWTQSTLPRSHQARGARIGSKGSALATSE